jgi:hypothetical protein
MFCQFEKSSSSKFATLISSQFASSISTSSSNQFENSWFSQSKFSFIIFNENKIILIWRRSTKQIINAKTNKSNFESFENNVKFSFLSSKFDFCFQNFRDFSFFFDSETLTQHSTA